MALDADLLIGDLIVKRGDGRPWLDLTNAITDPPTLALTMDGAATVTVPIRDADDRLISDKWLRRRAWCDVAGRRFELVRVSKSGRTITLTFEDGIVAALRRRTSETSFPADTLTRAAIVEKLAAEADVPVIVDDSDSEKVHSQVTRSKHGETENSWDLLGDLAAARNWRRFSDGRRLIEGPDAWLLERDTEPVVVTEPVPGDDANPVESFDFDLDVGKRMSEATLIVDATRWAFPPGSVARASDAMGPASGKWLVWSYTRPLSRRRATVVLRRKRHELDEPERIATGDLGVRDYLPTSAGASGIPGSGAREKMVQAALAQAGKPYVYGASGPDAFDCSGLVQWATRAAGKTLAKPSASQAAACAKAGKSIPVATALRTRGALLFRIGEGDSNHVAISLGNGSTIEAMGTAYGVGVFGNAASRSWTSAALWL
ncbi:hypothetical protein GCM10022215_17970 [Nocardioides fonticola]|uniref:NlpC/P60 domain-containing protein n=1 Tax=Nocardioides fonticola TaxID=450363 RepID=A0ABP7XHT8_9ACTN